MSVQPYRVLLVDDEPWNRDILRNLGEWEQLDMVVAGEAEDGDQALQQLQQQNPHIIITDMRMPGTDGVALLETLSAQFPQIKVIVVSGYDDFNYAKHAIRHRAADYLLKPVNPDELNAVLAKCRRDLEKVRYSPEGWEPYSRMFAGEFSRFQQQVRIRFNELNMPELRDLFNQLEEKLEKEDMRKPQQLGRVVHDLQTLLGELCSSNGANEQSAAAKAAPPSALTTASAALAWTFDLYSQALEGVIAQRKFKNKLNLEEVRQHMEQHCMEAITLEQLAQVFFVSKEYLSKAFKKEYGITVVDYIVQLRMAKAKEWVMDDSVPFKHIAEMVGYEDVSYFYRVFKKHFGLSPGEMRKGQSLK